MAKITLKDPNDDLILERNGVSIRVFDTLQKLVPQPLPDFEPIDWVPEDFIGHDLIQLNGKRFRLNNGVTIDRVVIELGNSPDDVHCSWTGNAWNDGSDNLLTASLVSAMNNEYEISGGFSGPRFYDFVISLPV